MRGDSARIHRFPDGVHAQGFVSPSIGYSFGGNAGCRTAADCTDKNWNWGASLGSLGSLFGFEAQRTYEGEFTAFGVVLKF